MRKNRIIRTSNREIYKKFNLLHFSHEVLLENATNKQLSKLLKSINKNKQILEIKKIGSYVLVSKKNPLDFEIYLS